MATDGDGRPMTENSHILSDAKGANPVLYSEADSQAMSPVSGSDKQHLVEDGASDGSGESSTPFASFNYINSIIGSGIIGMPYALDQAGIGVGIILLFVIAIITDYSLVLLIQGGIFAGTKTYQGLMEVAFGRPGFYILSLIQFVYPFIAMISYNIIIGDTITKVLVRVIGYSHAGILNNRNFIVAMVTLFVTLPISLFRQLSKLAKISLISLVFVAFIIIAILIRAGTLHGEVPQTEDAWQFANTGVTKAIGVMAFSYMCHHNSFLLYDTLKIQTQRSWNKVTHISILVALCLFLTLGIGGYSTFTGLSQGDVLENYCISDDLMNVCRIFFSFTIMLTYPIECFVAREVVENVFFSSWIHKPTYLHLAITCSVVIITYCISLATDCLGIVLELNGNLAAAPLAYILPALCYLRVEPSRLLSWKKLPALIVMLFGFTVTIFGLILTFITSDHSCSHGHEMPYCLDILRPVPLSANTSQVMTAFNMSAALPTSSP